MTIWTTHGLWERTAPAAPVTTPLAGPVATDVVVVGAGYTGLSTALHLAEAGVSVTVIEAEEIGHGGSGRNSGLLNPGLWLSPEETRAKLGVERGDHVLRILGEGPKVAVELMRRHGIDCELETSGTLYCAVGRAGLASVRTRVEEWRRHGAPVEFLDAETTAARTGSRRFAGALFDARAGTIQPLAYVRGLARAAIGAGATIHTRSRVTGFARQGATWRVTTATGHVEAGWLILATNVHTDALQDEIRRELVRVPYFNIATAPLDASVAGHILPGGEGAWNTLTVPTSFRRDAAGRLIIGSVGAGRAGGAAVHTAWAKRELKRLFPELPPVEFEVGWNGLIGLTSDSLPHLKRLGPNAVSISGCNGRGIVPGTVYGRELAAHLLGRVPFEALPFPETPAMPTPFRGAREIYYEAGAQIAHAAMART